MVPSPALCLGRALSRSRAVVAQYGTVPGASASHGVDCDGFWRSFLMVPNERSEVCASIAPSVAHAALTRGAGCRIVAALALAYPRKDPRMKYGFVIDQRKCIGCHACTVACKAEHDIPIGV